ncbi:hypothetical protein HDU67_001839 [Dinochytrium kinnereticum]|nr:hypothetical protein HDU67_001839 [Dinochytrium kinnereticum]
MATSFIDKVLSTTSPSQLHTNTSTIDAGGWDEEDEDGVMAGRGGGLREEEDDEGEEKVTRAVLQLCLDGVDEQIRGVKNEIATLLKAHQPDLEAFLTHGESVKTATFDLAEAVLECVREVQDPENGLLATLEMRLARAAVLRAEKHRIEVEKKRSLLVEEVWCSFVLCS